MLSRSHRLSTSEFNGVFESGRIYRHPLLQMRAFKRPGDGERNRISSVRLTRAAFVAPKKLGPAVLRNRIRRRLSEAYRARCTAMEVESAPPVSRGFDLIFLATAAVAGASFDDLGSAFDDLLRRLDRDAAREKTSLARPKRTPNRS
jgi:ribonuclease P protein component